MQSDAELSPRKRRNKSASPPAAVTETDEIAPPVFAEPGTAATIPEDRDLHPGPTETEIQEQLNHAERVLTADPNEPADSEWGDDWPEPTDTQSDEDPISQLMAQNQSAIIEQQITSFLINLEKVTTEHAEFAKSQGHSAIASDFNTLRNAGRHLAKRIQTSKYWEMRPAF